MTRNRLHMVLAVLAMVVVAAVGFFVGVQPQLARAADDKDRQASVETTNDTTAAELARLREQAKALPQMRSELQELEESVPASSRMPAFYDQVDAAAAAAGVTVSAITTSDAVAYTPPTPADAAVPATTTATSEASASPTSTPSPSASATPAAPGVTTDPKITAANFTVIPVAISVDGSFAEALAFASEVQDMKRLFLVNSITSSASEPSTESTETSSTTWNFGGYVYVLSDSPSATATTAPTAG